MIWSDKQQAIFDWVKTGHGSAVCIAVAGAGKSTTIAEAAWQIPQSQRILMLAYNKSAADNLKAPPKPGQRPKLPPNAEAKTVHALGNYPLQRFAKANGLPKREPMANKVRDMLEMLTTPETAAEQIKHAAKWADNPDYEWITAAAKTRVPGYVARYAGNAIVKLVSLAKQYVVGTVETDPNWWAWAIDNFELESDEDADTASITAEQIIGFAKALFDGSTRFFKARGAFDFDDMIFLPIKLNLRLFQYDWVVLDEAQDTNPARRILAGMALKQGGRLMAVGDPAQAIYAFTGANSDSLEQIKKDFNAIELPLTVSYRCPTEVVRAAREFVGHIEPAPGAPTGKIEFCEQLSLADLQPTDAVLCRKNSPLVDIAYRMMAAGKGVRIMGKDIGAGLVKLIDRVAGKRAANLDVFLNKLEAYRLREVEKAAAKGNDAKAEAVQDRCDCIRTVAESLPEARRNIAALREAFETMFSDTGVGVTTLSTIHKAKGGEWPRVWLIGRDEMPSKRAKQEWQMQQEINLLYVAYTRAQDTLILCAKNSAA